MSYHIINTSNPNHYSNRSKYSPRHPLSHAWLHGLWEEAEGKLPYSGFAHAKKRRQMAKASRKLNRR